LEIEAGYLARRAPPNGWVHAEPVLLKLTLAEWVQVQLGANGKVFTTGNVARSLRYLDDITFGPKFHLLDQSGALPSIAVSASLSIPSWDRQLDFPYAYDTSFWGYLSKDEGPFHFDLNGGLTIWQFDVAPIYQGFVTFASSMAIALGFGAMAEVYTFSNAGRISPEDGGLLMGLSYAPVPWLMFDAVGDSGFFPSTRPFSLFAGFTVIAYDFYDTRRERERRAQR